jgi:hypothetical protein
VDAPGRITRTHIIHFETVWFSIKIQIEMEWNVPTGASNIRKNSGSVGLFFSICRTYFQTCVSGTAPDSAAQKRDSARTVARTGR